MKSPYAEKSAGDRHPSSDEKIYSNSETNTGVLDCEVFDVLCGRGGLSNHVGNQAYLKMIESRIEQYRACKTAEEKNAVSVEVFMYVKSKGGRFLKRRCDYDPLWYEISFSEALEKVKQALRKPNTSHEKKETRKSLNFDRPAFELEKYRISEERDALAILVPGNKSNTKASDSTDKHVTSITQESAINKVDVIGGQGGRTNLHPGNQAYLKEIEARVNRYKAAETHKDKTRIAEEVVAYVENLGGRFMKKGEQQVWYPMSRKEILEKVKQALRKCNTSAERKRKRAETVFSFDFCGSSKKERNNS